MKVKCYSYIMLDEKMEFCSLGLQGYPQEPYFNTDNGYSIIPASETEIEVDVPNKEEIAAIVLPLLDKHREKLKEEHRRQLTKLQFLQNQLLGLPAPEIVEGKPRRSSYAQEADDSADDFVADVRDQIREPLHGHSDDDAGYSHSDDDSDIPF